MKYNHLLRFLLTNIFDIFLMSPRASCNTNYIELGRAYSTNYILPSELKYNHVFRLLWTNVIFVCLFACLFRVWAWVCMSCYKVIDYVLNHRISLSAIFM